MTLLNLFHWVTNMKEIDLITYQFQPALPDNVITKVYED